MYGTARSWPCDRFPLRQVPKPVSACTTLKVFTNRLIWLSGKLSFLNGIVLWLEKALTKT